MKTCNLPLKVANFNNLSLFLFIRETPLSGCRYLYFFSLCDSLCGHSDSRTFQPLGRLNGKNARKNLEILAFKPLLHYKRYDWKTWLSERFSEALTSKLWNKENTCWRTLQKWSQIEYTVLEVQFRSVKCTIVTRIRKNFEQLFIPIQAIQGDYSVLM